MGSMFVFNVGRVGVGFETTVRECLDILTIILHNIEMEGDENYSPISVEGYPLKNLTVDYAQAAAGLGAYSELVEQVSDLNPAIERTIARTEDGRPASLDIDHHEEEEE